ncbi:hypothetical protein BDV97DRAFT_225737 [Delphinella strobiligena]|nr:hypothetical protein BDV97DRAFT_225737 [Delphinella strobiligena]
MKLFHVISSYCMVLSVSAITVASHFETPVKAQIRTLAAASTAMVQDGEPITTNIPMTGITSDSSPSGFTTVASGADIEKRGCFPSSQCKVYHNQTPSPTQTHHMPTTVMTQVSNR